MYTPLQGFVLLSCVFDHFVTTYEISTVILLQPLIRVVSILDNSR